MASEKDNELVPFAARTVGEGVCPICGFAKVPYRINKNGKGTGYCPPESDGGCNTQLQPKGAGRKGTTGLLSNITRWRIPEVKQILGIGSRESAPVTESEDPSETAENPGNPVTEAETKTDKETADQRNVRHDKELFG